MAITSSKKVDSIAYPRYKKTYRSIPIDHILKSKGDRPATLTQKLNQELIDSYNKIILTQEEINIRKQVFEKIKNIIEAGVNCRVEAHGSFRTNTMVYDSDIDMTVLTDFSTERYNNPSERLINDNLINDNTRSEDDIRSSFDHKMGGNSYKTSANKALAKIQKLLVAAKVCKGPILHIKHARIPIIKCTDLLTNSKIDIVMNQVDALKGADFVTAQLIKKPYLRYLIILLKYFLKRRQLSAVIRGGLCSYGQFLLILNFVQLHPLIQEDEDEGSNENSLVLDNLGTIMMDFFQFYGIEFPFEIAVISVLEKKYKPNRVSQICIEDPINPTHNVSSGCTSLGIIREVFTFSYKIMAATFLEKVDTRRSIGELWLRFDDKELYQRKMAVGGIHTETVQPSKNSKIYYKKPTNKKSKN